MSCSEFYSAALSSRNSGNALRTIAENCHLLKASIVCFQCFEGQNTWFWLTPFFDCRESKRHSKIETRKSEMPRKSRVFSQIRGCALSVVRCVTRSTSAGSPSTMFGTSQRYECESAEGAALPSRIRVNPSSLRASRRAPSRERAEFFFVSHNSATTLANSVRGHIATLGREKYRTRTSCTRHNCGES